MTPPPKPFHLLRIHAAPLATLTFNADNTLLLAGDQDGYVSVTDLRSRRVVRYWKAHEGGVLGVDEYDGAVVSHGRDNKIHFYEQMTVTGRIGRFTHTDTGASGSAGLKVLKSLDVNALNFCRFSLARLPGPRLPQQAEQAESSSGGRRGKGKDPEREALLAVPSLLDSEVAEIYHLPSLQRHHASINSVYRPKTPDGLPNRSGLIMSLHLKVLSTNDARSELRLVIGFEDGRVEGWSLLSDDVQGLLRVSDGRSENEKKWKMVWQGKKHNEAIMAMTINSTWTKAYTVSADHILVSYDLNLPPTHEQAMKAWSTKQIGHSSIAISPDDKVLAVGGWDGRIRLFSAETGKPLGDLEYHRETVHALAFARPSLPINTADVEARGEGGESTIEIGNESEEDEDDVEGMEGVHPRERWLASGGKDRRIALWGLKDFTGAS